MSAEFRKFTFKLLQNRPAKKKLVEIASETGLGLPWLTMFNQKGDRTSSSVDKVTLLYEYLTGDKLVGTKLKTTYREDLV